MTLDMQPLFLAEVTAYLPSLGTTTVLRYSSGNGYTTGSGATPPNTYYDGKITQAIDVSRTMFTGGTTQGGSRVGVGDLILENGDGALDGLVNYGFDGRSIVIRRSTVLNPSYPADFTTIFSGTMAQAEFAGTVVTLKVRDLLAPLTLPIQTNKFLGTNVLPAGLEGVATDLQGKPKPLVYGQVTNISPPCVNTSKRIYQVNDGAIASVDAVYDKGVPLTAGTAWSPSTSGFTGAAVNQIFAACYGGGLFVAGAGFGKIATSPDGITWTQRTTSFGGDAVKGLCYGNGLYVAVGTNGTIETSPDGITWTVRTSGTANNLSGVTYEPTVGLFVAVGLSGTIITSANGTTWTTRTSGVSGILTSVCFAVGVYVAVGYAGIIITSPDGITWTTRTTAFSSAYFASVVYGNGLFVALGSVAATSVDGLTWTLRATIFPAAALATLNSITFDGTRFYGVGGDYLVTSTDGLTWTIQNAAAATGPFPNTVLMQCIASGTGTLIAVGTPTVPGNPGIIYRTTTGQYATTTDLLDDTQAPGAGQFKMCLSAGYIRLGSTPAGTVTADVTQGANAAARTVAQLYTTVLTRSGLNSGNWSTADVTALDAVNSAVLGIYIDQPGDTFLSIIDQIANSVGAWWGPDQTGLFRIKQFTAPSGTPVTTITANDLIRPLSLITSNDPGQGLPVYRCTLRYGEVYTVQTTDLAGAVTDARRAVVAQQWRSAVSTDLTVQTSNLLAPETTEDSLLTTLTDAQAESDRRLALRKVQRFRFECVVPMNADTTPIDFGSVIELVNPRYALSVMGSDAGSLFRVIDIRPNATKGEITLSVWGRSTSSNVIASDGAYIVTSGGKYLVASRSA